METKNLSQQDSEIPEDLGIKIGSEEEAFWTNQIKEKLVLENKNLERNKEINEWVIQLAEKKIKEEQDKRQKEISNA